MSNKVESFFKSKNARTVLFTVDPKCLRAKNHCEFRKSNKFANINGRIYIWRANLGQIPEKYHLKINDTNDTVLNSCIAHDMAKQRTLLNYLRKQF
jgi:hypothetical protein